MSDRHIVAILEDSTNPNPALVEPTIAVVLMLIKVVVVLVLAAVGGVMVVFQQYQVY